MNYRYLFGPVPSRRLGISLGVDLVPHKVCTMDCVYCECGPTTRLTMDRQAYVPTAEVIRELDAFMASSPAPDTITFSGSGEPTLHRDMGLIARHIKDHFDVPLALLTNSTLFFRPDVRADARPVDLILPSLDSARPATLQAINRPHPEVSVERIIDGLVEFCRDWPGRCWLEIFILPPHNTTTEELDALQAAIDRIAPERVQLNTADRPGTEEWVKAATPAQLEAVVARLRHPAVEIISRYRHRRDIGAYREDLESAILETVARRPCTADDLCAALGLRLTELNKYLDVLESEKQVRPEIRERGIFYRLVR
ncbi:MAG: radical SAM protein [Acidobacteria bacterium]|nr:radical SAM protein [Acidobacteriota bacterium]